MSQSRLSLLSSIAVLVVSSLLLLACSSSTRHSQASSKPADNAPVTVANASPTPPVAPPGTTLHQTEKGDTIVKIVSHYFDRTSYMKRDELAAAIRSSNPGLEKITQKGGGLKPGEYVIIPGWDPNPVVHTQPIPKDFEVRAIYLTGTMSGGALGIDIIRRWHDAGGNAVVFDIKDSDGSLSIAFDHPLAPHQKYVPIRNLPKFLRFLHEQKLHAIARIAIFRDENIATNHTDLTVGSRRSGQPGWRENGKLVWTDPSNPKVQEYNIALAKYVAKAGADEIQFDYVRFPAEGDQKDTKFHYQDAHPQWQRSDVIADFLQHAYDEIRPTGALFSLDVFGVMAWQRNVDLAHTGQDIVRMAKVCDVLSPMIYPSHFFGMDGYQLPGDAPEHFITASMDRFGKITAGTGVVLRPWLQAFGWKTKTYSPDYIRVQVKSAKDTGGIGFLFWNARNDYSKPLTAMPVMRASSKSYFRGDGLNEPKPALAPATQAPAQMAN